eukprot:scaffold248_cov112-Skeletonema_menzelii.AAC.1
MINPYIWLGCGRGGASSRHRCAGRPFLPPKRVLIPTECRCGTWFAFCEDEAKGGIDYLSNTYVVEKMFMNGHEAEEATLPIMVLIMLIT